MKKIVRLTESELKNIVEASVKRAIQEGAVDEGVGKDMMQAGALGIGLGGALLGTKAALPDTDPTLAEPPRAYPEDVDFLRQNGELPDDRIASQEEIPDDTISWRRANGLPESRIRRAVMESIMNLMNEGKPADTQIGRHKFKAIRRDKNGNSIYTHEGGTLSDDDLKAQGWKYSKKHGLHGQISDPTKLPK